MMGRQGRAYEGVKFRTILLQPASFLEAHGAAPSGQDGGLRFDLFPPPGLGSLVKAVMVVAADMLRGDGFEARAAD